MLVIRNQIKLRKITSPYNIAIEENLLVVGAYAKNIVNGEDGKAYLFDPD